jgi:hypothetical protein
MICTRPWRRITLHFSHIVLTLGRTFMLALSLPVPEHDATSGQVVGGDFDLHAITRKDPDAMHAHLPGAVGQDVMAVFQLDFEHRVREWLDHCPLERDALFL